MNRNFRYYVAGLFDGEGCVGKKTLTITNSHKIILIECSRYLSLIGIKNKITKRKSYNSKYLDAYDLDIYGKKNLDNFYTYIPFIHREKRKALLKQICSYSHQKITDKISKKIMKLHFKGNAYRFIAKKFNLGLNTVWIHITKRIKNEKLQVSQIN